MSELKEKDKYPQWLFVILQNDYGEDDPYWYDVDVSDEAFKEAYVKLRSLKRKYSDYTKWRNACAVYDEYIDIIIEHNGGEYAVDSMFRSDIIPEGWVPRPRLKNKKSNREILNTGLRMSDISVTKEEIHAINEIASQENPLTDEIRNSIPDVLRKPKGVIKDAIYKAMEVSEAKNRISNMYKDRSRFDVLSTYYSEFENDEENGHESLDEMFENAVEAIYNEETDEGWRPVGDYSGDNKYIMYNNNVRKKSELAALDVAAKIFDENDIMVFDTKNMTREKVSLYRSRFGVDIDPKSRKKAEKRYKQYEKEREKKHQSELDLARALARNQNCEIDLSSEKFTLNDYRKQYKKKGW